MTTDLFDDLHQEPAREVIAPGAVLLRGFARAMEAPLLDTLQAVIKLAPLRHMQTPGGFTMTVATTSCGPLGWVSSAQGYRYAALDPRTDEAWPAMPACFLTLAQRAAAEAGFADFAPDACLINRYAPGAKLSLHQDLDEQNLAAPIVSVSLGLPAVFLFGGLRRTERPQRYRLVHGDVMVWGGPSRLAFHGVLPLAEGEHALLGHQRVNLTFRRAA